MESSVMTKRINLKSGFTIIELIAVIAIIGIISTILFVLYSGSQSKAQDVSVLSDIDAMDSLQTNYGLKHNTAGLPYYSGTGGYGSELGFTPSNGNVIDVVVNSTDYCIRGYSLKSSKNSINNPFIKESTPGICASLNPSDAAVADNAGSKVWIKVVGGREHTCGIASNNKAYCWGYNGMGQLGNNSTTNSLVPVAVDTTGVLSGKTIKSISLGYNYTCAIASDDKGYCWGENNYGRFGNNSTTSSSTPVAVDTTGVLSGKTLKSISAGQFRHTCAIASDDKGYCWGDNTYGMLGNASTTSSLVPVAVSTAGVLSGKTLKSVSAGADYTCAIASDNNGYCWGYGAFGMLGNNSGSNSSIPVSVYTGGVLSGKTINSLSSGFYHTCAIASDNLAYCWGFNSQGELGNNSYSDSQVPVSVVSSGVLSGKTISSLAVGSYHACVIASDNKLYCWGSDGDHQLGNNSNTNSSVPVSVDTSGVLNGKTLKYITAGSYHTCAIASDNQSYCWGNNRYGPIGNNSTTNSYVPALTNPVP